MNQNKSSPPNQPENDPKAISPRSESQAKSDAEILAAIEHVVRVLSKDFTFGYYDQDDIAQQIRLFSLQRLPQYDGERDLANYLYVAVKRRLLNLVRDKFKRSDSPCKSCHSGEPCAEALSASEDACPRYSKWAALQASKSSLMQPVHWSDTIDKRHTDRSAPSPADECASLEIFARIDAALPAEFRADYAKMRDGVKLPRKREDRLLHALRLILNVDPDAAESEGISDE